MLFDELKFIDIVHAVRKFPTNHDFSKLYEYKIRLQGTLPSCAAHSWIACMEYLRQIDGYPYENLSTVYHYYMSRKLAMCEGEIKPIFIETSLQSFLINGALPAQGKILNMNTINCKPQEREITEAKKRIIDDSISILKLEINAIVFKYVLTKMKVPFVAVIKITKDKLHSRVAQILVDEEDGSQDVVHAICIVGYDDEEQVFIFQNSYGVSWHYSGFGKLHYSYLNRVTKAIAIDKSCIKDDEEPNNINLLDFGYIIDELTESSL